MKIERLDIRTAADVSAQNSIALASRYTERDRVIALSGLITAKVLGIDLPHASDGLSLYEEYDRLMQEHGRRTEFS